MLCSCLGVSGPGGWALVEADESLLVDLHRAALAPGLGRQGLSELASSRMEAEERERSTGLPAGAPTAHSHSASRWPEGGDAGSPVEPRHSARELSLVFRVSPASLCRALR